MEAVGVVGVVILLSSWFYFQNWFLAALAVVAYIWFVREKMAVFVPENTALILVDARGNLRVLRPGLRFKRPWLFEKPVENPSGGIIVTRSNKIKFDGIYEAKGFTIRLSTTFIIRPVYDFLEKYIQFEDSERAAAIIERVRNIISVIISEYDSREVVKEDLEKIGWRVNEKFSKAHDENPHAWIDLEHFYGVKADQFVVDPENPAELVEAQNRLEAQKKENERQKSEVDNFGNMAENLVTKSKELGSPISTKEAMKEVKVILCKTTENINVVDLGPGAQKVAEGLTGGVASIGRGLIDVAEKFADKKKEGDDGKK